MKITAVFAVGLGLLALSPALRAQDVAAVTDEGVIDGVELSVVDRWLADRATIFDASEVELSALEYVARPLVVFADNPNQPDFIEQMRLLEADMRGLATRDVMVIVDSDPSARSAVRATLRPRGFSLVVIDKDGRVAFRKPEPWDVREITRQIDKFPSRQDELLGQRPAGR